MKIAVMMAAHNVAPHVEAALGSLLCQRQAANLDIIVVNDGSIDGTGDLVRRLAAEAPEIRLIEQSNVGITRTRNVLLDALAPDTDLVTTLDADDLSPEGRFARDVVYFERDPGLEMHYGKMLIFRGEGHPLSADFVGQNVAIRGIHLGALLARRSLIERIGRFDESFTQSEDTDFLFRLIEQRPAMLLGDDLSYLYRRHDNNTSSNPRIVRREFARALLAAARRRRTSDAPAIPADFFNFGDIDNRPDWF